MNDVHPGATGLLETALDAVPDRLLEPLRGARLLVTGATGFFGGWVLAALERLNGRGFDLQAQCVSRQPQTSAAPWLSWLRAEVEGYATLAVHPATSHVLHMATSSDSRLYVQDPLAAARLILESTQGAIGWARTRGAHLHFVSSGAVYGPRTQSRGAAREDQITAGAPAPLDRAQAYGNAKRMAESLVACAGTDFCISRPFAFLGPGLPLDQHFAAGNFVRDAVAGRPIAIRDGAPIRSYMHPADLAAWLLALLGTPVRGQAVNIGSDRPVSIAGLAEEITRAAGAQAPLLQPLSASAADPAAYWPDTALARSLGLTASIDRPAAIADMLAWARGRA